MKFIEKVILENFQSHKNTIVEFDNQLNVIIGPSDSGKTAILRGIKWALYNEPSGDYFIREGETECSVTIIFNDKTKIKRYRNKTKNIYYAYDTDNIETKFEGFGTSVPQEIMDKIGIKKILLDSDQSKAINLSNQLEGAFLLSEKGSTRANSIGRLVGVNIIDDALRETLKDSRNLSQTKKMIDDNIIKLEDELKEYDYLLELTRKVNQIEIIRNKIYDNNVILNQYKELLDKFTNISKSKKEASYYVERLRKVDLVSIIFQTISSNIDKYKYFENKLNQLDRLKVNIKHNINLISTLKDIELAEKTIENIIFSYNKALQLGELQRKLKKAKSEINELSHITKKLIYLEDIQCKINDIVLKTMELEKVTSIKVKDLALSKSLYIGNKYIDKLQDIDRINIIEFEVQSKIEILKKLEIIAKKNTNNNNEILKETNQLNELNNVFNLNLENYKSLLLSQETCPLCFSNINNEKINHIIEHYK